MRKVYVEEVCLRMCVCGEGFYRCIRMDYPQVLALPGLYFLFSTPRPRVLCLCFLLLKEMFSSIYPFFLCFSVMPLTALSPRPPAVSTNKVRVTPLLRRAALGDWKTISEPMICLPEDYSWSNGNPVDHPWTD